MSCAMTMERVHFREKKETMGSGGVAAAILGVCIIVGAWFVVQRGGSPLLMRQPGLPSTMPAGGGFNPAVMQDVDGRSLPEELQFPRKDVVKRWRPWELKDHRGTLVVENLRVHDVTNQKAIDIGLWSTDRPTPVEGEPLTYCNVIVRNCEIYNVTRDEVGLKQGLHIDFLRICGGGDAQQIETDVLVEDVYVHDGTALPLLIQEGKYGTITLRRVRIENTSIGGTQIGVINQGHIRNVIVEECPGLKVSLMGRPGSIENCVVRNSPGANVGDPITANGRTGVRIAAETTPLRPLATPIKLAERLRPVTGPTSRPVDESVTKRSEPVRLLVSKSIEGDVIHASLSNLDGEEVAFVVFEAFDSFDYRLGQPAVLTEAPWRTDLKPQKSGKVTVRATVTRLGGDAEHPLEAIIDVVPAGSPRASSP
jgi:hypothetical protein